MKKIPFVLLFTLICFFSSYGQKFYSRNYTINDGLPDNSIREIYKDSKGFLWLGTEAGLTRFDGKSFKTYTTKDGLAGNKIWSIAEDNESHLWIACRGAGISQLNGDEIITYNKDSGLVSNFVRTIHYSKKFNILLIGTEDGLSVLKDEQFISFSQKGHSIDSRLQITQFIEEKDFIYVFTNGNGLFKYIPDALSLIRIPSNHKLNQPQVNSAFISNMGDTLINFKRKNLLSISDTERNTIDWIGQVTDFVQDSDNNIWISAWDNNYLNAGGIFKFSNGKIESFGKYINLNSKNVYSVEFDPKERLVWIGTKEDGLFLYPLANYSYYKNSDFKLDQLDIVDLKTDPSNNLWIAGKSNVIKKSNTGDFYVYPFNQFESVFDTHAKAHFKNKYSYLIDKNGSYQKYETLILNNQYPYTNPYKKINTNVLLPQSLYKPLKYDVLINKKLKEFNSISIDKDGNAWIGSNVGIFKIDNKSYNIQYFDLEGNQFSSFHIDDKNNIYGVNWADLFIYPNIESNQSYYLFNYYENKSPINVSKIVNHKGNIWFSSTDHGIFVYKNGKFYSTFTQNNLETPSFNDLCIDNEGRIIAAGNNGSIYFLEFNNDSIQVILKIGNEHGLKGTSIRYLCCNQNNILVAGTNEGLNLIDLNHLYRTGKVQINCLYQSKGFTDYSGTTCTIQDTNVLWIGSKLNLIKIDLKAIKEQDTDYINLYLKSIIIGDSEYNLSQINNLNPHSNIPRHPIKLPYHSNNLTFNYDAISYLDPANVRFNYKLDGFHKDWIEETSDRKVVFQNLDPGIYRLRIKLNAPTSNLSDKELSISFVIAKPFWLKWWFISASLILILFLIWIIIILRTRSIKKKERLRTEIAERITEFELKALRAQMNPHFIFNAINSIQNYMLDNDIDAALSYLSDFAKLIRLTLDNVSKKTVTLEEELNYIKYYINLEQMRFDKEFETKIIMPDDWEGSKIMIPSMILQPFVENSIKHGFVFKIEKAKIKLEFQILRNDYLKCIIEDNGIGRKKSRELNKNRKKHSSKGTFITNERLALLNQTKRKKGYKFEIIDLYDDFGLAAGTRVEIFLPI